MMTGHEAIDDDEHLYRRVPLADSAGNPFYTVKAGKLRFSSTAFNDRGGRPSVDRAKLQFGSPQGVRFSSEDGVVALPAVRLRAIPQIQQTVPQEKNAPKVAPTMHSVCIEPAPLFLNRAHAEIAATPALTGSGAKSRFKEQLARVADASGWTIQPGTQSLSLLSRIAYRCRCCSASIISWISARVPA